MGIRTMEKAFVNQQLMYVAASYTVGVFSFLSLILWIRLRRSRALQFLKQSFFIQDYESDSKK